MFPIFTYQKLLGHIDGTSSSPLPIITNEGKTLPNNEALQQTAFDQRFVILLYSSLTEEAIVDILDLVIARQIWFALEAVYSNAYVEHIH